MTPATAAEAQILALMTCPQQPETVPLSAALGRVLAAPVLSALDFPHWDNSAMDGYAVRHQDLAALPAILTVVEEIPAGRPPTCTIQPGEAARILTGSMMPDGADTVVMQELTQKDCDRITILEAPSPGAFVRRRASFHQAGAELLPAGVVLGAPDIAVLAAAQCAEVSVHRRLRVAILSTGDELVQPHEPLGPGQIVDSNQFALAALVQQAGAEPICLGIVPDDPIKLRQGIATAVAQADVVLSSGGVSVGDYDFIDQLLTDLGATLHIRSVAVKPGKPLTVATLAGSADRPPVLYFGLPGNPVSSLVSFWRFVQPALQKGSGRQAPWGPLFLPVASHPDLKAGGQRETYLWGQIQVTATGLTFSLAGGSHSSGNLINLSRTNALAVVPQGQTHIPAGKVAQVMVVGALANQID